MLIPIQDVLLYGIFVVVAVYAAVVMAQPPRLDIGFGRAENIALGRVVGRVEHIERAYLNALPVFEVDVREDAGPMIEVVIDARDGHVLRVSDR